MVSEINQPFSVSVRYKLACNSRAQLAAVVPCPVGSPELEDERLRQTVLDRSRCYLVFHSVEGVVKGPPVPITVVSRPKLAGLSGR